MNRVSTIVASCVVTVTFWRYTPIAAAQCSMCRTGLLNSPEGQQLIAGFNSGILFLLAVPIVIFSSVLFLLWRAARNRSLAAEQLRNGPWEKATSGIGSAQLPEDKLAVRGKLGEPA